jgi:hypothetical protein
MHKRDALKKEKKIISQVSTTDNILFNIITDINVNNRIPLAKN